MNMNLRLPKTFFTFLYILSFVSCSNTDSDSTPEPQNEPELTEHYYFEGKLDNEPFLIEKKFYKDFSEETPFQLDFGGTLINCNNTPENDTHSKCYTRYASGILVRSNTSTEDPSAKMYFGPINVEERIFDIEIDSLRNFLGAKYHEFSRDFGDIENQGGFAFDFFPKSVDGNIPFYYSSRFNDNTDFMVNITTVKEIEDYFFVIEGTVNECKLYDSREINEENQTFKLLTDFKFRVKINGAFNYNNYKND